MKLKYALLMGLAFTAAAALPLAGCGDDENGGGGTTDPDAGGGKTDGPNPTDSPPGDTSMVDGSLPPHVVTLAKGTSNGSSVALSPDESRVVVCNRDKGSVTVFSVSYAGATPAMTKVTEVDLGAGSEPWQVAIDPAGDRAYVVLRQAQKVVRIDGLDIAMPRKGPEVAVGSEPTGIALNPHGTKAYVTNWVDGTVNGIDTEAMTVSKTFDLNKALIDTNFLGAGLTTRPGLAHPRSIAVTNNGNADDTDESLYVTEYYGQRIDEELTDGSNADTTKNGVVYRVKIIDDSVVTVKLAPLTDIGFAPTPGATAGCFVNQIQSITLNGKFAYVLSVCASPRGPLGVRATPVACPAGPGAAGNAECNADGSLSDGVCQATNFCNDVGTVKTTTAPVLSVIDTSTSPPVEVNTAQNLNKRFTDRYVAAATPNDGSRRLPLLATDLTFVPGTQVGYIAANGSNAAFRVVFAADGTITSVGSDTPVKNFIDLTLGVAADFGNANHGLLPTGAVAGSKNLMFVANDVSRNVSVVDLGIQAVAGGGTPVVVSSSTKDASEAPKLKGKLFFNTGLGRWSLRGQGWGACQSCHVDGLTDNVTWYFGRGPRQSTSLDGSFSANGSVQRLFNWTAIFDDVADFEGNTRGTSGGVGAIVKATALDTANRINEGTVVGGQSHAGLNGSSKLLADSKVNQFALVVGSQSVLDDWAEVEIYLRGVRSPRGAKGLDATKVAAGKTLFTQNKCDGCHGGALWTISELFYTRTAANAFAKTEALFGAGAAGVWDVPTFPIGISPTGGTQGNMRANPGTGNDQILCAIRQVNTFNVAELGVGIAELRSDMTTAAQGANGFSPPSLLGVSVGGPYLHAGNARTLEALFSETFPDHHRALSANFLDPTGVPATNDANRLALIHFLLSIDDATTVIPAPAVGASGGKLCQ